MGRRVVCTCKYCRTKFYIDSSGVQQPGVKVPYKTRLKHEKRSAAESDQGLQPGPTNARSKRRRETGPSSDSEDGEQDILLLPQSSATSIAQLCCTLALWLYLHIGVSRFTANKILRALSLILSTTIHLLVTSLIASGFGVIPVSIDIPRDIRTVCAQADNLEPDIIRIVCCPGCFSLIPQPVPWTCQWRKSSGSQPCNETLWKTQNTPNGPKWVPRCHYSTQSFDSWLTFFLSRPEIEDHLEQSFVRNRDRMFTNDSDMHDIQDSPAWQSLGSYLLFKYNLVFALYVDWLNPFTNKIAGKVLSCGVIALVCLNLPQDLRYLAENIFIIGLMPPPYAPDVLTISHILTHFVDVFLPFWVGKQIVTFQNPLGALIRARILPLIADLQAIRKIGGFLSPTADHFCTFCDLLYVDLETLNSSFWNLRTEDEVRQQAQAWLDAKTNSLREELAASNGVRWVPLHRLPYWNPVVHLTLDFMHNFLEGVLQYHLRIIWGIGRHAQKALDFTNLQREEKYKDTDAWESSEEAKGLKSEVRAWPHLRRKMESESQSNDPGPSSAQSNDPGISSAQASSQVAFAALDLGDDDDPDDPDYIPINLETAFDFSDDQIQEIRNCIKEISLPTWVNRPPRNLGEKEHGKLRAQDYVTLFADIFPLVIPELWYRSDQSDLSSYLLKNFYDLVAATNIICSYTTSNSEADAFQHHYLAYRQSMQQLFPDCPSMPNHHFAMHNPDIMKYWGPMPPLGAFGGERLNGRLQKVNTNNHTNELDLTMLRQYCRLGRFDVKMKGTKSDVEAMRQMTDILLPKDVKVNSNLHESLDGRSEAGILAAANPLPKNWYEMLLCYLRATGQPWRAWNNIPHPEGALIVPPRAMQPNEISFDNHIYYSCRRSHSGNSAVRFWSAGRGTARTQCTGFIESIWQIPLDHTMQTFFLVRAHTILPRAEEEKAPFHTMPRLQTRIVSASDSNDLHVIEPHHVITHLTVYKRPAGTYNISTDTLVINWALNRGRRN